MFGDELGEKFGEKFSDSLNLVNAMKCWRVYILKARVPRLQTPAIYFGYSAKDRLEPQNHQVDSQQRANIPNFSQLWPVIA